MSSAGLVYKHYGKEIIQNIATNIFKRNLDEKTIEMIYQNVYRDLIMELDAIDNGINQ